MTTYYVEWAMDIDAESPREAAEKARTYQCKPNTTATVFDVTGEDGETIRVDLLEGYAS